MLTRFIEDLDRKLNYVEQLTYDTTFNGQKTTSTIEYECQYFKLFFKNIMYSRHIITIKFLLVKAHALKKIVLFNPK